MDASSLSELALRILACPFSARRASNSRSNGDPSARETDGGLGGLASSESVVGQDSVCSGLDAALAPGESVSDRLRQLGIGSADGAGEAWNVDPAKMGPEVSLDWRDGLLRSTLF